ncbi:MAG: T9SS type A sorting domain-containing protein [Bacteroidales bacterium]|nr:T9SS type A sorting domain-containing protein [Bacteroidales bacterium]
MKRNALVAVLAVIFLITLAWVVSNLAPDKRESYDKFLSGKYSEGFSALAQKPDSPELAAMQNYFMTIDPAEKRVPRERLYTAYTATVKMEKEAGLKSSGKAIEWMETGSNMGGRTRGMMWDPNDPDGYKVWAGGVTGGLWYNDDISDPASSWEVIDDFWPSLSICCMAYDPNNTMIFYVGTGEPFTARNIYRESSGVGVGIWKSEDGGETWDLVPSTSEFKYISDIKVRNEDGTSVIYAGVVSGDYHGVNHQSEPSDGLYRSADGGQTWEQVLPDIAGSDSPYAPADIDIGPDGRIFVGTMKNLDMDGGATILYSDAGTSGSWTVYDDYMTIIQNQGQYNIPGRVIIACAPSDPDVVYALVGSGYIDSGNGFNYEKGGFILRSDDKGQTWIQKNQPQGSIDWASISWHAFVAAVNPSNKDELFIGGLDVWKSLNACNSWNHVSDWSLMYNGGGDEYVHADQHIQLYRPGYPDEMIFGSDGGVFYTHNSSNNYPDFQEKNKNYSTLQFYTCDIYPVAGQNYFVGGLQDNGTLLYLGQPLDINDMIDGGDGAYCFFDEDEAQIMITSIYYNRYTVFVNFNPVEYNGDYSSGVFINPADYDSPNNTLYANAVTFSGNYSNRILRLEGFPYSTGGNGAFVNLNTGLNVYFSHVRVSPYASAGTATLFVGSQNGKLFRVTGAQASPAVEDIGSQSFPVAYLSSLAIGGSEDTLAVTFSNYGIPSVWQTYDAGNTWDDISGNLPDMPIRWALYHPQSCKNIMLATELGIWTTQDGGASTVTWLPDPEFPNVRCDMLQMRASDNTVLVATHGRGLFYGEWNFDPPVGLSGKNAPRISISPNPSSGAVAVQFNHEGGKYITLSLKDTQGKTVFVRKTEGNTEIQENLDLGNMKKGMYFLCIEGENIQAVEKLVLY